MTKEVVRAKDRKSATRIAENLVDVDSPEGMAVRYLTGEQRSVFPLLFHLVEAVYGPTADVCYTPDQLGQLSSEIQSLQHSLAGRDPDATIFHPHMDGLTVRALREFLADLLAIVDAAIATGESLYAFGD